VSNAVREAEGIERAAWRDLILATPDSARSALGLSLEQLGATTVIRLVAADLPLWNRAFGLLPDERLTRATVDAIRAHFEAADRKRYLLQVPPGVEVAAGALDGLRPLRRWAKVRHALATIPDLAPALEIRRVSTESSLFAATGCEAFGSPPPFAALLSAPIGRPGWSHYLAMEEDRAIAVAAMYAKEDVAWFGVAATLPSARRRGAQQALLAARLRDAKRLGLHSAYSEADEDLPDRPNSSVRNLLRLGFELLYHRDNFGP